MVAAVVCVVLISPAVALPQVSAENWDRVLPSVSDVTEPSTPVPGVMPDAHAEHIQLPQFPVGPDGRPAFLTGQAAITAIGTRIAEVAAGHGLGPEQLRDMFTDPTLAVDAEFELAYFDTHASQHTDEEASVPVPGSAGPSPADPASPSMNDPAPAPPVDGAEFALSTLPGADKTIYLDFDGHTAAGTSWNQAYGVDTLTSPPYDTDGDPNSWSSTELRVIRDSWAVVAEDFAPWDVNVTTTDPGTDALSRSGGGDETWGVRVVITDDTFAGCGCGGHAYIGSFDDATDEPAFVYNSSFKGVSEAISHEVGHTMLLAHDGTTSGTTYYRGHGSGATSWAPIMGAAYSVNVGQWSRQEYAGASNADGDANYGNGPDDFAIISSLTNGNGFGLRTDDHADNPFGATPLTASVDGTSTAQASGLISSRSDVDTFTFSTSGGATAITVSPSVFANLDIYVRATDSDGTLVGESNDPVRLAAALSLDLPAGDYSIAVTGVGVGDPAELTGYSDYGSLGQYSIEATFDGTPPTDTDAPATPSGLTASTGPGGVTLSWALGDDYDLAEYRIEHAADIEGPYREIGTTGVETTYLDSTPLDGLNAYRITAVDTSGNVSDASTPVSVTIGGVTASTVTGESSVAGVVSGTWSATTVEDGQAQSIREVSSGGRPSQRHDLLEHRWQIPALSGPQNLSMVAAVSDGGDADSGMRLDWSDDGISWIPLGTFGGQHRATYSLGTPSGQIWLRITDTDRSAGEQLADEVEIDLLRLEPAENVEATTAVVSSFEVSETPVGRGRSTGTVTVGASDNLGRPLSGAEVVIEFSGDFTDQVRLTTDARGIATYTTSASVKKPSFAACVVDISAAGLATGSTPVCRNG